MEYLWIIMLIFFGGLWSLAAICDIISSIRSKQALETLTGAWIFAIIMVLFFWSLALWCAR